MDIFPSGFVDRTVAEAQGEPLEPFMLEPVLDVGVELVFVGQVVTG